MKEYEDKHIIEYLILILGLGICLFTFYLFRYDPTIQLFTGFIGSLFYTLWGIVHHALEGRLNKSIFIEYLLVGIFIFSLLSIVVFN